MAPALERPARVTEIQVRIDCNGCVQKIKKALHGINGIYDVYIDLPRQKLTIVGWADPEKIMKAIKKTRKTATLCSQSEVLQDPTPSHPTEPPPPPDAGAPPPPDASNPPPAGPPPPAEPSQPQPPQPKPPKDQQKAPPPTSEPPKDQPPPPPPDNPPPPSPPHHKDVEEVHVIHHHPPDHVYRYGYPPGQGPEPPGYSPAPPGYGPGYLPGPPGYSGGCGGEWSGSPGASHRAEMPEPVHVIHSYNHYRPPPTVTRYEYVQSPPRSTPYARMDNSYYYNSNGDYQNGNNNGYITSMFSEENPNACTIS